MFASQVKNNKSTRYYGIDLELAMMLEPDYVFSYRIDNSKPRKFNYRQEQEQLRLEDIVNINYNVLDNE